MGCLQLTYEPKFKIVHRTHELMRSHEAKSVQLWLSVDPLAEETPEWSPYAFCNNNPLFYIDPTGMSAEDNDWHPDKNGNLVADAGDSTKSLAEYQGISYDQAAKQLADNGYKVNDKGILNLNVGDSVNTGSFNLQEVVVQGKTKGSSSNSSTPWMDTASSQIGVKEVFGSKHNPFILDYHATTGGFKNDEIPWCSSFVNWTFMQNDIKGTNSAMAMSWKNWGQNLGNTPAYGSVAVFSYGGGKGHVGFVAGRNSSGKLIILGGNQSDQVKYSAFGTGQISRFVYPKGYKPNYTLPTMSVNGNTSFKSTR